VSTVDGSELQQQLAAANLEAARAAPGHIPLHAAAVDSSAGVIALAGVSRSGKSTLAAAAVLAGYPYVADEITAISADDLTVRPYHRPIGLRRGGADAVGVHYPDSADGRYDIVYPWDVCGAATLSAGGTLAGIVLVEWRADASPSISAVSPALALAELTTHTVIEDEQYQPAFERLNRLVRAVPIVRMTFATTEQSLELLAGVVERWAP
jgi:hypothetical protein